MFLKPLHKRNQCHILSHLLALSLVFLYIVTAADIISAFGGSVSAAPNPNYLSPQFKSWPKHVGPSNNRFLRHINLIEEDEVIRKDNQGLTEIKTDTGAPVDLRKRMKRSPYPPGFVAWSWNNPCLCPPGNVSCRCYSKALENTGHSHSHSSQPKKLRRRVSRSKKLRL